MSFNTRRIIALIVVLVASICGGLIAMALTDSQLAIILGVVGGAVVGMVFILTWINQSF